MNGPRRWLFAAAYTCSGLAGLVYEVTWTRLLTLYMGHTIAAASTVLAAFMGGLAVGAAVGGRLTARLTRRQALYAYAALELFILLAALAIPALLHALEPLLRSTYRDGAPGVLYPAVRFLGAVTLLTPPAVALGATFPMAVRAFVTKPDLPGRQAGLLYAVNTLGAATGAAAAGFFLIPVIGISGTTLVGVAGSALSVAIAGWLGRHVDGAPEPALPTPSRAATPKRRAGREARSSAADVPQEEHVWLAASVVALTGFATFLYEIAWTRVLSLVIGPSTYAFAATLTGFITGIAVGSFLGSAVAGRTRRPGLPLSIALGTAAIAGSWAASYAGGSFPRRVMQDLSSTSAAGGELLLRHSLVGAVLILPIAIALGVAFPLTLELAGSRDERTPRRVGVIYATNTVAAVAGSLIAGFIAIPLLGMQNTLRVASVLMIAATLLVVARACGRLIGLAPAAVAFVLLVISPPWDRALLSSGMYKYATSVPRDLDLETILKAGELLYYEEGATATVSVKRLTGELSLAIDGKIDASTSGDMLTQKLLAHLPLLLHSDPSHVGIVGLGSGVTLTSALVHPVESVDVVEISPEVVAASRLFAGKHHQPLDDSRTRLIVGDGRSHLALGSRRYDVIISEPSNPWMAGVAALFTREFFEAARDRLNAGGILCQWAHTYDISDGDLRSIVATFRSVFPDGTMWLVGDGDLLLLGSSGGRLQLENISEAWTRPGVAADLEPLFLRDPFGVLSLFVGGAEEMKRYAGDAPIQHDDRMALEFTGPLSVNNGGAAGNVAAIRRLLDGRARPPAVASALASAGAAQWRARAAMMLNIEAYGDAYGDYVRALASDPTDTDAHAGFVRTAVGAGREADAERLLASHMAAHPGLTAIGIALSRLQATTGAHAQAVATAEAATLIEPLDPAALEQLASLHADAGDAAKLQPVAAALRERFGNRPGARYYSAVSSFLRQDFNSALGLARETIAVDPKHAAAHNLLGAIYASMNQPQAARESFETVLRLNPSDASAYTNLGLLALESGDRKSAANLFVEALSLDPQSLAARDGLAQAHAHP